MDIKTWLELNSINAVWLDDQSFSVDDKKYLCIAHKNGRLFDDLFDILISDAEAEKYAAAKVPFDYYCFSFGGKVYYSPCSESKVQLNIFKHVGKASNISGFPYLGIHGGYELCNGSRVYEDWCQKAKFLGVSVLGIAERHSLAGALKFQEACQKQKIKFIIGETITIKGEKFDCKAKLFVANEEGWYNLLKIHKRLNVDNKSTFVEEKFLYEHSAGLYMVIQCDTMLTSDMTFLASFFGFKKVFFQLDPVMYKSEKRDKLNLECFKNCLNSYWKHRDDYIGLALICDSYYLDQEDARVKKILNFIGNNGFEYQSEDQYFKSFEDVAVQVTEMFTTMGEEHAMDILAAGIDGLQEIVDGCDYTIKLGEIHLPKYELSETEKEQYSTAEELFWHLIETGLEEKVIDCQKDIAQYIQRVEVETDVIVRGGFIDYFLIIRDIINWSEQNGILVGTGRGSIGGSIVAYLLNVTKVDAIQYDLLFERFLNESRIGKGLPDIDTDFESGRRNDVKRYIEERYGKDNVCSIGTYNTLQLKGAFRDILRYHGEQPQNVNYHAGIISESNDTIETLFYDASQNEKLKNFINDHFAAINDIPLVLGQAKSSSIHAAGIVITPTDYKEKQMQIYDWFPCKVMDDILISEWEGPQLDAAGYLKADILGLSQLDKLRFMYDLIKARGATELGLTQFMANIDLEDPEVFDLFKRGLNQDVFQFGTDGLITYCREVKPENINELADINALYRPGPMDSGAHTDYVKIKFGKKEPEYDFGTEEIASKTHSLLIYQEQVMQVCVRLAGFTLTQADDVRKAMGKKIPEKLKAYQEKFVVGAVANGCPQPEANKIWNKLVAFAGYGFNRSHAVAYCIIGYQAQWFKLYYPMEFWTVSLQSAKDEEVAKRISEIKKFDGINIAPPDINKSRATFFTDWDTNTIFWSLSKIQQVGDVTLEALLAERENNGKFYSIEECVARTKGKKVNKAVMRNLILSGCFDLMYNIDFIPKRMDLITEHCRVLKEEIPDMFKTNEIYHEFFWFKLQREVSGFGFFDYESAIIEKGYPGFEFLTPEQIAMPANEGIDGYVAGILVEVIKRKTKKGEMGKLTIDHNNDLIDFIMWPTEWQLYKQEIDKAESKGIILNGKVLYDNYNKKNSIYSFEKTQVEIF